MLKFFDQATAEWSNSKVQWRSAIPLMGAITATLWLGGEALADSTTPADGWRPLPLVLTRIPMHFTRRKVFQIAPGPHLPEAKPFSDVRQEVVNDAAIVWWRQAFLY